MMRGLQSCPQRLQWRVFLFAQSMLLQFGQRAVDFITVGDQSFPQRLQWRVFMIPLYIVDG